LECAEAIVLGYRVYGDTRSGFVVERAVVSYMPMFPELPGGNTNGAPGSQTFCDSLLASDEIPTVTVELASMTALAQLVVGDFDRKKYITRETTRPPFERTRSTVVKFGSLGDSRVPECLILQVDEVHHLSENNNQRCDATGFHPRN
jgi:hypothetical protein